MLTILNMEHGICTIGAIPVRITPSHRAEMVTQLLFGELFYILDADGDWIRIRMEWDQYEGWITAVQAQTLDHDSFTKLLHADTPVVSEPVQFLIHENSGTGFPIVAGSSLPGLKGNCLTILGETYHLEEPAFTKVPAPDSPAKASKTKPQDTLCATALIFNGAPYCWGGRSISGLDCSGFMQIIFKINGIRIGRDASHQASEGNLIPLLAEASAGDLLFFDNGEGKIIHVGMLLDSNRIIHCYGMVRIDPVDHYGIFNRETQRYSHSLRMIRRLI